MVSEHIDLSTFHDDLLNSVERMKNILGIHQYAGENIVHAGCGPITPVPIYLTSYLPAIINVIFHDPATIVFWSDGSKTVVKCQDGDTFSKETGLSMAIAKKALGNKGRFNETFKQWIPEYGKSDD